jgi:hypothetical protein
MLSVSAAYTFAGDALIVAVFRTRKPAAVLPITSPRSGAARIATRSKDYVIRSHRSAPLAYVAKSPARSFAPDADPEFNSSLVDQGGLKNPPWWLYRSSGIRSISNRSFTAIRSFCLHPR